LSKKVVSGIVLILVLTGMLALAFNVQPASSEWTGTVHIRADGSIDPSDAPIVTYDKTVYTLTDTIISTGDGIVVERDNIVIDGEQYALLGSGTPLSKGIDLTSRSNITIKNLEIKTFYFGLYLFESSNNTISRSNITANSDCGIYLFRHSANNNIIGNKIINNCDGIYLGESCSNNYLTENYVKENDRFGITFESSSNNMLRNNVMIDNTYNLHVAGDVSMSCIQDMDSSNTVDGKPILYLINKQNILIDPYTYPNIGYLAVINSSNVTIQSLDFRNNGEGILFVGMNNSLIRNMSLTNNFYGIRIWNSFNNNIIENNIQYNGHGIQCCGSYYNFISGNTFSANFWVNLWFYVGTNNNTVANNYIADSPYRGAILWMSSCNNFYCNSFVNNSLCALQLGEICEHNIFYHNNFIDNTVLIDSFHGGFSFCIWDDGYPNGGNYWSDYTGLDLYGGPNQDELGSDGIGDIPYQIPILDEWGTIIDYDYDNYPLMKPWGPLKTNFNVIWDEAIYPVVVVSNSTIADFNFSQPLKQIVFNVSGPDGTKGLCNTTIPKALLYGEPWTVLIDGAPVPATITENATHSSLYFAYTHSTHKIQIIGTWVIGDITPPLIATPFQEPDKVTPDQAVKVSVNVTDTESGVKSVILSYTANGGAAHPFAIKSLHMITLAIML